MNKRQRIKYEKKYFGFIPTDEQRIEWTKDWVPYKEYEFERTQWNILNHYLYETPYITDCYRIVLEDLLAIRNRKLEDTEYLKYIEKLKKKK